MLAGDNVRKVAIVGGNRIPFARSNTAYFEVDNQEMLTAALNGLVDRFKLHGERMGEVAAGAVMKHAKDFNLVRECVLGSKLAPETPAYDLQQACGTGLQAAIQVANKIALGQIEVGIAGGTDTTSDAPVTSVDIFPIAASKTVRKSSPIGPCCTSDFCDCRLIGVSRTTASSTEFAAHHARTCSTTRCDRLLFQELIFPAWRCSNAGNSAYQFSSQSASSYSGDSNCSSRRKSRAQDFWVSASIGVTSFQDGPGECSSVNSTSPDTVLRKRWPGGRLATNACQIGFFSLRNVGSSRTRKSESQNE